MVAGKRAGTLTNGYRYVGFDGRRYKEHRIIFFMHHGYMPAIVDHKDRNKTNNTLSNLRAATKAQNQMNVEPRVDNKHGIPGLYYSEKWSKWRVHISFNGKEKYLGQCDTLLDAACIRRSAENQQYGEYVCRT